MIPTRLLRTLRGMGLCLWLVAVHALAVHAQAPTPAKVEKFNPVLPLPEKSPPWIAGYRIRWPLRVIGDLKKQTAKSIITSLPTGGWLKPDGSDLIAQTAAGELVPVSVLSHDPNGETIIQFKRKAADPWYWVYGVNPAAAPPKGEVFQEGITAEVREWAGEDLGSWAAVRAGLQKSENVIGNAIMPDVIQNTNPARPGEIRKFAASYRGFLNTAKAGIYRFFVNSDDASFLFIDGFKVFERTGSNKKLTGAVPINKIGVDVDLKVGVHPFEVHHVLGNNPDAVGSCALMWKTPDQKTWTFLPAASFAAPLYALPSAVEEAKNAPAAGFNYGIDDTLQSGGITLYLVRFEASGNVKNTDRLLWNFGDGTTATGRSVTHVYFKAGNYVVNLTSAEGLPPARRNVFVWPAPGATSPLSLATAIQSLASEDWRKADRQRLNEMFEFLLISEQPDRWALLESVAGHLLQTETDLKVKATLLEARIQALAELGRASEALQLADKSFAEFAKVPNLLVTLKLAGAQVHHRQLKDFTEASKRYKAILEEHRRLENPSIRLAVIRWGDLFAETNDLARAGETYRLAATLGGDKFKATAQTEAITRGALLRIAEQRLRSGDIRQTRQLLERIELDYPEQKIEGLYRFLRAEADRHGGRYEESLRNYEVLLKLVQWAGYRDRALFGIADCYSRMGEEAKALDWLATLKESFPSFYEKQKLAETQKTLENRRDRKKNPLAPDPKDTVLDTFATGFEPTEKNAFGTSPGFDVVPSFGLQGPHVLLCDGYPEYRGYIEYTRPLRNLSQNGSYLIEMWVRDTLAWGPGSNNPHVHVWIYGTDMKYNGNAGMGTVYFERTIGRWRKLSFNIKGPDTVDGKFSASIRHIYGIMELDGVSVRPVTDRQQDSLVNFLEGPPSP